MAPHGEVAATSLEMFPQIREVGSNLWAKYKLLHLLMACVVCQLLSAHRAGRKGEVVAAPASTRCKAVPAVQLSPARKRMVTLR